MDIFDIYFNSFYGYKAIKRGFIRYKSQGDKLKRKGYHHVGTTSAYSPEQAVSKTISNGYETEPQPIQTNRSTTSTPHEGASGGIIENIWATSVCIKVLQHHQLVVDDIPEAYQRTLKLLAVSLKDKGLNKEEVFTMINKGAIKHGGLMQVLEFYTEIFGI